jgi:hypothetical protein
VNSRTLIESPRDPTVCHKFKIVRFPIKRAR